MRKLAAEAGVDVAPVTNAGMELLAAAHKAGAYRSAAAYLGIWKQMRAKAGHPWTADLEPTRIGCGRSQGRGVGPAKRAAVVRFEALPGERERAGTTDRARIDVAVVGAMWLLRGAGVAAILVDQAEIAHDQKSACLWLGLPRPIHAARSLREYSGARPSWRTTCSWVPESARYTHYKGP